MSTRKIIQVIELSETETHLPGIVILCNDGTLWVRGRASPHSEWISLGSAPQDKDVPISDHNPYQAPNSGC